MKKKSVPKTKKSALSPYILAIMSGFVVMVFAFFFFARAQVFCANSLSCIHNLNAEIDNNSIGFVDGHAVTPPKIDLADTSENSPVLGVTSTTGEKHIYVDLAKQTLYAFQGSTLFMDTLVSTGKWHPTPPGDYRIWIKIRSTRMSGGSGNDAYDLPNVPFVMFFANSQVSEAQGFSLHGAYWHDNFGHEMSHGCVNMRPVDAETIYNWADPPTTGSTTHATAQNPGTAVSICTQVQIQAGSAPLCIE